MAAFYRLRINGTDPIDLRYRLRINGTAPIDLKVRDGVAIPPPADPVSMGWRKARAGCSLIGTAFIATHLEVLIGIGFLLGTTLSIYLSLTLGLV